MQVKSIWTAAAVAVILLLTGCNPRDDTPGSVSPGEASALNDAAAMLDANSVDANAVTIDGENEVQPQ